MKRFIQTVIFTVGFSAAISVFADTQADLDKQILPLLQNHMPKAAVGIVVTDAKTGNVIYEHNGFQAFNPASNAKLFSTAAALYGLGADYQFSTQVGVVPEQLKASTVQGDLYVEFVGDPSFSVARLQQLIKQTHQAGVKHITGNVVIDGSAFAKPWYGPGWSQDDLNWYYAAPISAVVLNENCVEINLTANATVDQPAKLAIATGPLQKYLTLNYTVKTVTDANAKDYCQLNSNVDEQNHITLDGCWPLSATTEVLKIAVKNPERLVQQVLIDSLKAEGIQFDGKVVLGNRPKQWKMLAESKSAPLSALIRPIFKNSNNVYAECITKALGRKLYHVGSFQTGSLAIKSILHKHADINFDQAVLVDGSGQSRYDLITPRQIARLLFVMSLDPKFANIYLKALPDAGENGSLKGRMQSIDLQGHIHAKTGSFKGVSTLSGYLTSAQNKSLIFSLMLNHMVDDSKNAQLLQSQILQVLYQI